MSQWRHLLFSTLEKESEYQVVGLACDGLEAVQKTHELQPDIILLDIGLPMLNGIEVARRIQASFPASNPFLLAIAGASGE